MTYSSVERISARHETADFDCGSDTQNTWVRRHALQSDRMDSTRVWVVVRKDDSRVVGYYALSPGAVQPGSTPTRIIKGMPRYPVPVIILTRFGVDRSEQGRGLGRELIRDMLIRVAAAAEVIGARALLIHCENASAREFYLRVADFEPSPTDPMHLYLLLSDLRKYVEG